MSNERRQGAVHEGYVDIDDADALDRVLSACDVEVSDENRRQLRRFAQECQDITEHHGVSADVLVDFARPRLMPSDG